MGRRNRLIATGRIRDSYRCVSLSPAARHHKGLATYFRSAGREWIWQLRSQNGAEHSNYFYVLASTAFRANTRGVEAGDAKDPETEIWRGCQRSSTAMVGGTTASCCWMTSAPARCILLLGQRYSDERVSPFPGLSRGCEVSSVEHAAAVQPLTS